MAKIRLDELEQQKLDDKGESIASNSARELADRMVMEARAVVGKAVSPASPYARYDRDRLSGEAARLDIRIASLLGEDDLRFVVEHARIKLSGAGAPKLADVVTPVPQPLPKAAKIRGLKPSPTNTWRVVCPGDRPRTVSVGNGQMSTLANGKIVQLRNYGERILQSIVDQGVKLVPIEEPEPED
jgi:hypothetical protein